MLSCRSRLLGFIARAAVALTSILTAGDAAAQILRFTTTTQGGIVGTGNTLGLSKAAGKNGPGVEDSIGTFLSLGAGVDDLPVNTDNPWPVGTTYDWTQNGSSAVLKLPTESTVLYAELLWGGSTNYGGQDVQTDLDAPVVFASGSASLSVVPDPLTALDIAQTSVQGFAVNYYLRSADVTSFVKAAGSGTFTVSGVPATEATTVNSLNAAGWTLVVAYEKVPSATRNLSIFVGGSFVDEDATQDYLVSGFCAPPVGIVEGTAVVSAIEGDADLAGDQLLIGPSVAGAFKLLSGPNNPASNFFASQINGNDGKIDISGSFGSANHDALGGSNVAGARQGWDVTTVSLSSADGQLENGQTSAVLRTSTLGDSYVPVLAALSIDVNAPELAGASSTLTSSVDVVAQGDTFVLTATLENTGEVTAEDLVLQIPVPAGLSLSSFQTDGAAGDVNGDPVDAAALAAGVEEGDLAAGATRVVAIELEVATAPSGSAYAIEAYFDYGYAVCAGGSLFASTFTQVVVVAFDEERPTPGTGGAASSGGGEAEVDPSSATGFAVGGAGPTAPAPEVGGSSPEPSLITEPRGKGCGCALPGDDAAPGLQALVVVCAGLALRRRRRAS